MLPSCVNEISPDEKSVYSSDPPMALNEHDRDWIKLTINEALQNDSRGRLTRFKSWSPLGGIIAVSLFILLQWNGYMVFKTHTEDKLTDVDKHLSNIDLKLAATNAPSFHSIPKLLNEASKKGMLPNAASLEDAGKNLLRAIKEGQEPVAAWEGLTTLADYRTQENVRSAPPEATNLTTSGAGNYHGEYSVKVIPGFPNPISGIIFSPVLVARDQAAYARSIGDPDGRRGQNLPLFVGFTGSITLDDALWKNVVAKDATVAYHGSQLQLKNIYFLNCKFQIDSNANGQALMNAVLAGNPVNLSLQ
jgi:hypothetical protein